MVIAKRVLPILLGTGKYTALGLPLVDKSLRYGHNECRALAVHRLLRK